MLEKQLKILGYSDKEAKVYLTLNKIGASVASTLARLTGIKRTSIYDVLNSLLNKNVITSYSQGEYTYYIIDDLQKIFYQEKEKLSVAENLVKQLKDSQSQQLGIQIHHYKGATGFREMYEDILKSSNIKEVLIWVNYDHFLKVVNQKQDDEWTKKRTQKGIKARILMQTTQQGLNFQKDDSKFQRQTKLISQNFPFNTTCILYKNYIALFDPGEAMTGIRIYNPELFQMQKQIFEMNWNNF